MAEQKRTYQATTMALPPLKMVLGDLPEADPGQENLPFRRFGLGDSPAEAKNTVEKIIGHIKDKK